MKLSFSPTAIRQIRDVYWYIAVENPSAAQRVVDRIYEVVEFISEFPETGRPTRLGRTRVMPASPYPYLIFFRQVLRQDEVRIVRVRHAARKPIGAHDPGREFMHLIEEDAELREALDEAARGEFPVGR
jgi:plasmid stabilization system protein ParE